MFAVRTEPARAAPPEWPDARPPIPELGVPAPAAEIRSTVDARPVMDTISAVDIHSDASLGATAPTRFAKPRAATSTPARQTRGPGIAGRVATAQVGLALSLLAGAPLLSLLTGKPSGLAFALHGIGATLVVVIATMAMHKAYPLMRGGMRTWPALRSLLGKLAIATAVQAASSLWILDLYLRGPGRMLAQTNASIDQLAMQFKVFGGLVAFACFGAAWWSSRHCGDEHGDGSVAAPVFALAAGWLCMITAYMLGTAITWVMPV